MWYFEEPFDPTEDGRRAILRGIAGWLASTEVAWLLENMPSSIDPEVFGGDRDPSTPPGRPTDLGSFANDPVAAIKAFDTPEWTERGGFWNFRDERERQEISKVLEASSKKRRETVNNSIALGLQSSQRPSEASQTVFVSLGGARMAPLLRTRMLAREMADQSGIEHFVLLGTNRKLGPKEIGNPNVETYRNGATTEFELMQEAGRAELGIDPANPEFDVSGSVTGSGGDPFFDWRWKTWEMGAQPNTGIGAFKVHAVQAPTTRPGYRAHTGDSLEFLGDVLTGDGNQPARQQIAAAMSKFDSPVPRIGTLFVLSTSAIYRSVQHLDSVRVLNRYRFRVQTIGHPVEWNPGVDRTSAGSFTEENLRQAINYLQEVRGTINAALRLVEEFELSGDA